MTGPAIMGQHGSAILPNGRFAPRARYRGLRSAPSQNHEIHSGQSLLIKVTEGSLISIRNIDGCQGAWLCARGEQDRNFGALHLGATDAESEPLDALEFDNRELTAMLKARDGVHSDCRAIRIFDDGAAPDDLHVTRAETDILLCVILPQTADALATGGGGSLQISVTAKEGKTQDCQLPEPFGKIRDEWRVSRGTAKAYELRKGQFVQIIDIEGQQCSDFMALRADALEAGKEMRIDSTVSRTLTRSAYPQPGIHNGFYDQDMRPMLAVRQDTVGRHDTFALACTARGYEERGFPGHVNCSDNISNAFAPYSIQRRRAWPAINFFFNSWIDWHHHALSSDEAWSRAGDYILMEAQTDLVCVSTACPDDVDPINGWNPTDVHVRIYEEDTSIQHAVCWRGQPEDAGRMTKHSAFHPRTSQLTSRFHAARDLWLPSEYDATGSTEEYWACKRDATLQDMSGLRVFDVVGPDAEELLQHCLTRNVAKLSIHRALYALICDARGSVLDDGTLFRLEPTAFRWCCGSENSALHLREQAEALGLNARVLTQGNMAKLALQGPKSRDILSEVTYTKPLRPSLENLKWFGFTVARLFDHDGPMFMLSRTGFTGELGYELFCAPDHAVTLWDALMKAGAPYGLTPMGGEALNMLRIEAGLMIAGAEFGPDVDAFESGLGFAVDLKKENFLGKAALERNAAAPRRRLVGLKLEGPEAPAHGDPIYAGREQVGVITSACYSPQFEHALAMARIAVEDAEPKTKLEVGKLDGCMKRLPCTVTTIPFLDPKREKARA